MLDADRHGGIDGVSSLYGLFSKHNFDLNAVPWVETPRNGVHVFFRRPIYLTNTRGTLAEAIDIKNHGYVISPGSVLPDGRSYRLKSGTLEQLSAAIAADCLPLPPEWLGRMLVPQSRLRKLPNSNGGVCPLSVSVSGLVRFVLQAEPGNRNSVLYWAARRMAEMVGHDMLRPERAEAVLVEAGLLSGLPASEVCATVKSGLRSVGSVVRP